MKICIFSIMALYFIVNVFWMLVSVCVSTLHRMSSNKRGILQNCPNSFIYHLANNKRMTEWLSNDPQPRVISNERTDGWTDGQKKRMNWTAQYVVAQYRTVLHSTAQEQWWPAGKWQKFFYLFFTFFCPELASLAKFKMNLHKVVACECEEYKSYVEIFMSYASWNAQLYTRMFVYFAMCECVCVCV